MMNETHERHLVAAFTVGDEGKILLPRPAERSLLASILAFLREVVR